MTKAEILRRLNALVALPPKERPISVACLEDLAALHKRAVYELIQANAMGERTRVRLERALLWVEQNQVKVGVKRGGELRPITIGKPNPPCLKVQIVRFTREGPKMQTVAFNPNAFPEKGGR